MHSDPLSLSPVHVPTDNVRVQQWIARGLIPFQLVIYGLPAQAQTAPDAGALRQQIEQGRTPALPKKALTELAPEPELMKDPGDAAELTVKEFQLRGNTLMSTPELQESLKPYIDRPLSFAELRGVAAKVGVLYRKRGWVVRTYLPQQEIKDGVFTIQIVEAMYGQTRIEDATTRLPQARVQAMVDTAQPAGAPLNADHLDRALLLLNDMPGVVAKGTLVSGQRERETDLVLRMADKPLTRAEFSADNTGAKSTGEAQLNGHLTLNSPFKMGEQLSLQTLHSSGSNYARGSASLPLGNDGLRIGANGSIMKYKLVSDQFASLDMGGTSSSAGLETSYPLLRSRMTNAYVAAYYDHKKFDNQALAA
jgi:hemolysin activation/secretion protein